MNKTLHILLLEDIPTDTELIERELEKGGLLFVLKQVKTEKAFRDALKEFKPDIILADYKLPSFDGISALRMAEKECPGIPFIFVSGYRGEELAVETLKSGAKDYVMKDNLSRLVPSIHRALGEREEQIKRRQAEESLRKSEARLANAQRIAHIGNWEWDIIKDEAYGSDEVYRIFGLTPGSINVTFKIFLELVHPDDRELVKKSLNEALCGKKPYDIDHRIVLSGGEVRIVHGQAEVVFDDDGKAVRVNGTVHDITKIKTAEEKLRVLNESLGKHVEERTKALLATNRMLFEKISELVLAKEAIETSENKYKILLENLPQNVFYKDRNSVYISCNENFARLLNIKPEEISGKTVFDFFPKEIAEKYRADDKEIIETGKIKDIESRYIKDGKELIFHTVKVPIKNGKDDIIGILGSSLDITEKANLEREAQLSRHLALIGELAAGVAHEINNPITGVINCARILFNKSSEGSREKDLASRIMKEGDRIANIVSKLLSFARPKGKEEIKDITNIKEILSDTLVLTDTQLRKEGITVNLDIPENLPKIFVNFQQIQQVFMNIISNARYALNQKYPLLHKDKIFEIKAGKITINKYPHIKITFCDYGTGIPANIKDKVMNPFFTTKPAGKGTGIGLNISQKIIHDHNGMLTIDSVEGEYTRVIITLPATRNSVKMAKTHNR